jgi:glutathione synthase/RimK-type ligase-like ATP-grasp enzyme
MILLLGDAGDEVLAFLVTRLADAGADFIVIDPRTGRRGVNLVWRADADDDEQGWLRWGDRTIGLQALRSVYVRDTRHRDSASSREEEALPWSHLLEVLPCPVVNRPSAAARTASKPYQSQIIARHGLYIPRTLITNIPEQVRRFHERCQGRVIYKSISYQRSIVRMLTSADLDRLDSVRSCPTQFQEHVPGIDVRVHLVGDRLFATEVLTTAVDYRYAGRDGASVHMRDIPLPDDVARSCRSLGDELGLSVAGIDLRRSPDGRWYCFEANPSPAFTSYQAFTRQPIGEAIVELLRR